MKSLKNVSILIVSVFVVAGMVQRDQMPWKTDEPVYEVLKSLGESRPDHFVEMTDETVKRGKELIKLGRAVGPSGKRGKYISKFYTCTSCHNVVREDPDLTVVSQDARLDYAVEKNIPYLQGSTFWGIVNRETWYNDDYVLKYGDLVTKAEHSLKESISLCATVCSQGRSLEDWETESILAYFWSLQIKMSDLDMSESDISSFDSKTNDEKIALIKSKFLQKSPATFVDPPTDKLIGYDFEGRPAKGKAIFELGCQHCHRPDGESDVIFSNNDLTLNWLNKHITDDGDKSIYQIIRKGTYAAYGHKEYMPHYTLEKMSHQQVEDLRVFIQQGPL